MLFAVESTSVVLIVIAWFAGVRPAAVQAVVSGNVRDATGLALPGVTVELRRGHEVVETGVTDAQAIAWISPTRVRLRSRSRSSTSPPFAAS